MMAKQPHHHIRMFDRAPNTCIFAPPPFKTTSTTVTELHLSLLVVVVVVVVEHTN